MRYRSVSLIDLFDSIFDIFVAADTAVRFPSFAGRPFFSALALGRIIPLMASADRLCDDQVIFRSAILRLFFTPSSLRSESLHAEFI